MIRYVCIGILLILFCLAIISRKNFSKYKDGVAPVWWISLWITAHLSNKTRIMEYIRRTKPLNSKALLEETDNRIARFIHDTLRILIAFLIILCGASFIPENTENRNIIERPDIGQSASYVDVRLTDKNKESEEVFSLEIYPREYTREEFLEISGEAKEYIKSEMLGNNRSQENVTEDLVFPTKYKDSGLKIVWETDMPTILGSDGRIVAEEIQDKVRVNITATIKDSNYSEEYETYVLVSKDKNLSDSERAKLLIQEMEGEDRAEKEFVLPSEVENMSIERAVEDMEDKLTYLFIFGMVVIGLIGYYRVYKLKEKGAKRDDEIGDAYYGFTNRLAIYIGAGFTIQRSLRAAIRNEKCKYLVNEVEYTLNMASSGISETKAYMDLGNRLGLEEYMRLMSLISQNLNFGNSNLLKLLDSEVKTSFFLKKERVRKKGEQASEKLLIPTSILLIIVIIVVMYPAFIGMR